MGSEMCIRDSIEKALKLKGSGNNDGAIAVIRKALLDNFPGQKAKSEEDAYTREYLKLLLDCLKGNEITYISVVKHTTSIIEDSKEVFSAIADKINAGKFSAKDKDDIKEMKLKISRERITHNFCSPPSRYDKIYNLTQAALFRYSKAWENIELIAGNKDAGSGRLGPEALANFQRANELFSRAGLLMRLISGSEE